MDTFAFIIHPIEVKRDVQRKFPLLGHVLTERQIDFLSAYFPPVYISHIDGIVSRATGKEIKGWFVACPLTPQRMLSLPEKRAYNKIIQTGRLAEKLGAKIIGLGAFTSVVGDGGITIANALDAPVTTGDAYTAAVAVEAVRSAAREMGVLLSSGSVAVVGAAGAIGKVCSEVLAAETAELHLIGRRLDAVEALRERIGPAARARIYTSTRMDALRRVNAILTVTSAVHAPIQPEHIRPGSVICDVARPRDVAAQVAARRDDVLVIDGGMVEVPGNVNFHFDFGFPPSQAYACMAETMALALEGRFEDFTVGKDIRAARVTEIAEIASRHGFRLSGFRSFDHAVSPERIASIRRRAALALAR